MMLLLVVVCLHPNLPGANSSLNFSPPTAVVEIQACDGAVITMDSVDWSGGQVIRLVQPSSTAVVTIRGFGPKQQIVGANVRANGIVHWETSRGITVDSHANLSAAALHFRAPNGPIHFNGAAHSTSGSISLHSAAVCIRGTLRAVGVGSEPPSIDVSADQSLWIASTARIFADGDGSSSGKGGLVHLKTLGEYRDDASALISASGSAVGGDGGRVELCAGSFVRFDAAIKASASPGWKAGELVLDPQDIVLGKQGNGSAGNGTVGSGDGPPVGALNLNVGTAFQNKGFSKIILQATRDILITANTIWDLTTSTGETEPQGSKHQLILQAGRNISFGNKAGIKDSKSWDVRLLAGYDFQTGMVVAGVGNVLVGSGLIELGAGNLEVEVGNDVTVGSGAIRTVAGGGIQIKTLAGNVNAGTANAGYIFRALDYIPSTELGQIATAAGGDVLIESGGNVDSSPIAPANSIPGATGAYGSNPGNVRITAQGTITGKYTVRNGVGTLYAGIQMDAGGLPLVTNPDSSIGSPERPVELNLINGDWTLRAARDIFLNEVRNPQGTYFAKPLEVPIGTYPGNNVAQGENGTAPSQSPFLFDYASSSGLHLFAGNIVTFSSAPLPRLPGNANMGAILPPVLEVHAGAGGIEFQRSVTLFPSPKGQLRLTTMDGGSLRGIRNFGQAPELIVSDSGLPNYETFRNGRSLIPLHQADPDQASILVSGDLHDLGISLAKTAKLLVNGDLRNAGFATRTFDAAQNVEVVVGGDMTYGNGLTILSLDPAIYEPLPEALLDVKRTPPNSEMAAAKLRADPIAGTLTYIGPMSVATYAALKAGEVIQLDAAGNAVLDADGMPVVESLVLSLKQRAAIDTIYALSQTAMRTERGLEVEGPGTLLVRTRKLDLGVSTGIRGFASQEYLQSMPLLTANGPRVQVDATGDIDTSFSRISSSGIGGSVKLHTDGKLDVGSAVDDGESGSGSMTRGIFTTSGGAVEVLAAKGINIKESRIASFNGGDVLVRVLDGDIKIAEGHGGATIVTVVGVDPTTGLIGQREVSIPGNGILAMTAPKNPGDSGGIGTDARVGNIRVETFDGNIFIGNNSVVQRSLNGTVDPNAVIDMEAHSRVQGQKSRGNILLSGSLPIGEHVRLAFDVTILLNSWEPQTIRVSSGGSACLFATSFAGRFEWRKDGELIHVGNEGRFKISDAKKSDEGHYTVDAKVVLGDLLPFPSKWSFDVIVAPAPVLLTPVITKLGTVLFQLQSTDGVPFTAADAARLSVFGSPDLESWTKLPLSLVAETDGSISFSEPATNTFSFYQVSDYRRETDQCFEGIRFEVMAYQKSVGQKELISHRPPSSIASPHETYPFRSQ